MVSQQNRIQFEKPDLQKLNKKYTVVDLHFHTLYSDGKNSIDEVAAYAEMMGIGVAITDHNDIRGAVEVNDYKNILSIPGVEVTSREGTHILLYFYDLKSLRSFYYNDIAPYRGKDVMSSTELSMETIVTQARTYGAIVIFPHPFCGLYTGVGSHQFSAERLKNLLDMVDGVEVINSENLNKWNLKSALLGFNLNKAISGGSDGHSLYQLGRVVTYAACAKNRKAFLDAIVQRENKVVGKEIDILRKVKSNGIKLRSNLKNYPDIVEKNFNYSRKVINIKSRKIRNRVRTRINDRIQKSKIPNN
jgi:predicted metal-dependent phosphoesterase TrpH